MHSNKQMHMVSSSIDGVDKMFAVLASTSHIAVQFVRPIIENQAFALPNGKDNVHIDLRIGISHFFIIYIAYLKAG